ncbi:hypothetical protein SBOR_5824 [Sclerotinia borealis F-4128]|uniref:Zn(2)-C6 fungal-type domain-containing protein n=1 Tax=Sclerotinia borealis (strain F-4128) TaxID=1432307 RepID=W9CH18_SCLBF|nr:hypothetical protein SBOR_5824 [Sclerotinia borealis F-4128]
MMPWDTSDPNYQGPNYQDPNYQAQHASGYQNANNPNQILAQNSPLHDVLGTPNLNDFDFTFGFGGIVVTPGELKPDATSDPFNLATSIEHRNSISSIPSTLQMRHDSISGPAARNHSFSGGSEEASPTSNRMGTLHEGDTSVGDDFGMNTGGPRDGSEDKRSDRNQPAPAWTELKTKAGKERKRLPLACTACRRKKIRCSGEKPACRNCTKSKIPCVYKVTTKKAAPRTDYMAMIDKRLKRMEIRIINILPKEEQNGTLSVIRANVKPPIPGTLPSKASAGKKRPAEETLGPELDNWSKSTSKRPKANVNQNQASKTHTLLAQEEEENKLLGEGAEKLPSRELQEHLAEVFFESVYGQTYHLLHKPSFMMKLQAEALPPVLVLAVCACAARFSNHVELDTEPAFLRGEEWASEARDIVLKRYDWPNITILTCLLILGFHEFGTCQGGRSWSLAGQAIRMAYALQLHKDLDHDPLKPDNDGKSTKLSFIDREIRRRTMWACFLMDRFESSGTGRPTFIKEENLEIQLPVKEHMFLFDISGPTENLRGEVARPITPGGGQLANPKQNMGVAAYVIRSIAMYSNVITYFNQGGSERDPYPMWHPESKYPALSKQLEDFQEAMPEDMVYNNENLRTHETGGLANQFIFLYVVIQQTALFLNRFAAPLEPGGRLAKAPKEFVTRLGAKAMKAAGSIANLIADGQSYSITAPFIGYCAFSASTVLVFGAFSKNPILEESSKKNLTVTVKYLAKMKKYWGTFHWMSEKLKAQYRMCAENATAGSKGSLNSAFPQYGDWFDQFPHGVSQSDFEDPAAAIKKEKGDDAVLEQKSNLTTIEDFVQGLPSPGQRPNPKSAKQKVRRSQSSSQLARPPNMDTIQTMPSSMQSSHLGMQASIPSSSHPQIPTRQAPQNLYNQNIMSPTSLYPPPHFYNHHELLMPPQQPHNMGSQQLDRQLGFNNYAGMDHSAINDNGMHGNGMNVTGTPGPSHNVDGTEMNWTDIGGMGNVYGMMGLENGLTNAWFSPFNMDPPAIGMDRGMNGDDAFGGAAYGRDFELRNDELRTGMGGVNGRGSIGGP